MSKGEELLKLASERDIEIQNEQEAVKAKIQQEEANRELKRKLECANLIDIAYKEMKAEIKELGSDAFCSLIAEDSKTAEEIKEHMEAEKFKCDVKYIPGTGIERPFNKFVRSCYRINISLK